MSRKSAAKIEQGVITETAAAVYGCQYAIALTPPIRACTRWLSAERLCLERDGEHAWHRVQARRWFGRCTGSTSRTPSRKRPDEQIRNWKTKVIDHLMDEGDRAMAIDRNCFKCRDGSSNSAKYFNAPVMLQLRKLGPTWAIWRNREQVAA